jgi:hypothetical protein
MTHQFDSVSTPNLEAAFGPGSLTAALVAPLVHESSIPPVTGNGEFPSLVSDELARVRPAIQRKTFRYGSESVYDAPFDQQGQWRSSRNDGRPVVLYQMSTEARRPANHSSVLNGLASVWAAGYKLAEGKDYIVRNAFGASRVYVYADKVPEGTTVHVEFKSNDPLTGYDVFQITGYHAPDSLVLNFPRRNLASVDTLAFFVKKSAEPHFKLIPTSASLVDGLDGRVSAVITAELSLGDEVCVVDRAHFWRRTISAPAPSSQYEANPITRVLLVHQVAGRQMPLPVGHVLDVAVYVDGLKLVYGTDYSVKLGHDTPWDPPCVQLRCGLPPGSVLEVESGPPFLTHAAWAKGSHTHGLLDMSHGNAPLRHERVWAFSKGRLVAPEDVDLVDDYFAVIKAGHGPDGLEVIHLPQASDRATAWVDRYVADLPQVKTNLLALYGPSGSQTFEDLALSYVIDNPSLYPLVDDNEPLSPLPYDPLYPGSPGWSVADYLAFGPGGHRSYDAIPFIDANRLENALTGVGHALDANDLDSYPGWPMSALAIDANEQWNWPVGPRAVPQQTITQYAAQAIDMSMPSRITFREV